MEIVQSGSPNQHQTRRTRHGHNTCTVRACIYIISRYSWTTPPPTPSYLPLRLSSTSHARRSSFHIGLIQSKADYMSLSTTGKLRKSQPSTPRQQVPSMHWLFRSNIPRRRASYISPDIHKRNFFGMGDIIGVITNVTIFDLSVMTNLILFSYSQQKRCGRSPSPIGCLKKRGMK